VPIDAGTLHPLVGPFVAMLAVGVLALVLRWAYGTQRPVPPDAATADHGLLEPVVAAVPIAEARQLSAVLSGAGIRSTVAIERAGTARVLVFPNDVDRARELVGRR